MILPNYHYELCDNYCRCSTLHPEINSIDLIAIYYNIVDNFKIENEKAKNDINKICSTLTKEDFECNVCSGYYGEEMDSIVINNYNILNKLDEAIDIKLARKKKLEKIKIDNVFDEKVRKILVLEYGYLLDNLEESHFSVIEVDTKDIVLPQKEYAKTLNAKKIEGYKNHQGICGIVKLSGGKYKVIDGYHRVTANLKKSKIKVILST